MKNLEILKFEHKLHLVYIQMDIFKALPEEVQFQTAEFLPTAESKREKRL
jgi:hypothetical protein